MQPVTPPATRHFAAGVLVDDDHLTFFDHVVYVLLVDTVSAQQLGDVVNALGLVIHVGLALEFFLSLFREREFRILVNLGELRHEIGQHESVGVIWAHESAALIGEIGFVSAFVDGEIKGFLQFKKLLFVRVCGEKQFTLIERAAAFRVLHGAHEPLVARLAEFDFVERLAVFLGLALFPKLLGLARKSVTKQRLLKNQVLNHRLEAVELMGGNGGWTGNDERRAGFVDENGVNFIHDRKRVAPLDLLCLRAGHSVVAQVVEAELGVHPVRDIAVVLLTPQFRRLVVLDDACGHSEEAVNLTHPFSVAARKVIVGRHQMRAVPGERVEKERQRGH